MGFHGNSWHFMAFHGDLMGFTQVIGVPKSSKSLDPSMSIETYGDLGIHLFKKPLGISLPRMGEWASGGTCQQHQKMRGELADFSWRSHRSFSDVARSDGSKSHGA